jgi:hypothetical protein
MSNKKIIIISLIVAALIFLFFASHRLSKPIVGWGLLFWRMAENIVSGNLKAINYWADFPLYASLIAFGFKLLGVRELGAYFIGILSILMVPTIIYFISKEVGEEDIHLPISLTAITLFITCPAAIQGALVIDKTDTHLLLLLIFIFYLFLFKTEVYSLRRRVGILAALYCVCLFTKFSTSLACLITVPCAYWISKNFKEGFKIFLSFFAAVVLFITIWTAFCYYLIGMEEFFKPFLGYAQSLGDTKFSFNSMRMEVLKRTPLNIFRIALWFSPFLLILTFLAILDIFKRVSSHTAAHKELQLTSFTIIVFLFYLYASPLIGTFPRYVIPVLPFFCFLSASFAVKKLRGLLNLKRLIFLVILLFAGIIYYYLLIGDCLYSLHLLREAQLSGQAGRMLLKLGYQQILYFLYPVLVFLILIKVMYIPLLSRFICTLLVSLIAGNVSLSLIQRNADYSVNYSYGVKGTEKVKKFLQEYSGAEVFTTAEGFIANTGKVEFKEIRPKEYITTTEFLNFMQCVSPEIFIYGLASNTVRQIKEVINVPVVTAYLNKHYQRLEIGSYNILIKNKTEKNGK